MLKQAVCIITTKGNSRCFYEKTAEILKVETGGTCSYHCALKVKENNGYFYENSARE
jgi:hypothetical protein